MQLTDYIQNVSRDAVVEGVKNIKRYHLNSKRIISVKNPLINRGGDAVIDHADDYKRYSISQPHINSFLAASSVSHMLDGWMYLSNAFNSLLNGDESTAIHLSYYAELRSAMSILATEGIGVFNEKNIGAFSSTTNGVYPANYHKGNHPNIAYRKPETKTHTFVWDAMDAWANSTSKPSDNILKIFKVQGKDFYEITEYFHPSSASSTLLTVRTIKKWLKEWCLDIKLYRKDRENRNEASYRPQRIRNFASTIDFNSIINEIDKYWSIISPSGMNKFDLLDKYLLRMLLDTVYSKIATTEPRRALIENAFNQLGIYNRVLLDFLDYQPPYSNEHAIFTHANVKSTNTLSIIARSALLLRIAVGLVSKIYQDAGVQKSELNFVWDQYAIDAGFWSTGNIYSDFNDLWFDVESSIADLKMDINSTGINTDIHSVKSRKPQEIIHFGQINRACLWGLDF